MGKEELLGVEFLGLPYVLKEAGEAAVLLVPGEDQRADVRLLDEELLLLRSVLVALKKGGEGDSIT